MVRWGSLPRAFIQGLAKSIGEYQSQLAKKLATVSTINGINESLKFNMVSSLETVDSNVRQFSASLFSLVGFFQLRYIEFFHTHERVRDACDRLGLS